MYAKLSSQIFMASAKHLGPDMRNFHISYWAWAFFYQHRTHRYLFAEVIVASLIFSFMLMILLLVAVVQPLLLTLFHNWACTSK